MVATAIGRTTFVYKALFGMDAAEMRKQWEAPVSGSARIARNYIPQAIALEAVGYCEKMVSQIEMDNLYDAHEEAIRLTRIKYRKFFPAQPQ